MSSEVSDHWFVRFPDGRVARAANTTVVRQQVNAGKIPRNSSVRRSPDDEWTALEWTREFADLKDAPVSPGPAEAETDDEGLDLGDELRPSEAGALGGLSARIDRSRLPTVGVRGMIHELQAALDSTLVRKKLAAAALAGLCGGLVLAWVQVAPLFDFESAYPWARQLVAAVVLLAVAAPAAGLLTQMTFYEVSKMRPARLREGFTGLTGTSFRIAVAWLLTGGVAVAIIILLRLLPGWLLEGRLGGVGEALAAAAAAVGMIVEVLLWPVLTFALLLPPILVVEDCSVGAALGHWMRLLRKDLGRAFLYEALALSLGLAATLLLLAPWLALFTFLPDPRLLAAVTFTRWLLAGFAAAPWLAYLLVANVFIYINLRYESAPAGRR